jgi:hypothetical protein
MRIPVGGNVIIENFRIRNPALSQGSYRAAILADSGVHITARDCRVDSTFGAVTRAPWDTVSLVFLSLERCVFVDIYGTGAGSAMIAVGPGRVRATDCSFSGQGFWLVTCSDSSALNVVCFVTTRGHCL